MEKALKNQFPSNYWCFCQKSCSWNNWYEKKTKESVVEIFKNALNWIELNTLFTVSLKNTIAHTK